MNNLNDVTEVLQAHAAYAHAMAPLDLSACWNRLAKLTALQSRERKFLRRSRRSLVPALLGPLVEHTARDAGLLWGVPLASTVHGVARVSAATGWQPPPELWCRLEAQATAEVCVPEGGGGWALTTATPHTSTYPCPS